MRNSCHQQIATECRRSLRTCLSIQSEPIADAYKKNDYSVGYYGLITKKSASHLTPEQLPSQAHYLLRLRFPYLSNTDRQQILAGTAYPVNSLASWQAVNPNDVDKNWGLINLPLAYDDPTYLYHDLMVNQSEDNEQYDVADFALADVWKNDISGKGRLIKKGGGILILAGNNSFAGLEINKGTVVLTGNNHYSQSTIVNNGILVVNGTLSSAINLNNGGRLMGSGSIAALKVNKGGILALGNSIGQLNVTDDILFEQGSQYEVEFAADGRSDKTHSRGKITLDGGDVIVLLEATKKGLLKTTVPSLLGKQYAILNADDAIKKCKSLNLI